MFTSSGREFLMTWFRLHADIIHDLKIQKLRPFEVLIYIYLMAFLAEHNQERIKNGQDLTDELPIKSGLK
jgi:hypothetical protein